MTHDFDKTAALADMHRTTGAKQPESKGTERPAAPNSLKADARTVLDHMRAATGLRPPV